MAKIDIQNVDKVYDSDETAIVAVEDFTLSVEDGEFIVLVGPSGCGKTTTLRCIAGLEEVSAGNIHFDSRDITNQRARDRNVAMVFQNYALYPHMNVKQNISFALKLSTKLSSAEIDKRVEETARMLGIAELLGDRPSELSGGQQQRVALGRAIIREPDVFLLDEPLSNLDAKLRASMRTEIQTLQENLDVTTVYVTHDQVEAMAMGDRIVVMNDGMLQQVGEPEEIYRHPVNEFVAGFIGSPSINLFTASVEGPRLVTENGVEYTLQDANLVTNQTHVRMGIRPEDLSLTESGGHEAVVELVEPMGNENFLYMTVGDQNVIGRMDSNVRPETNERVRFQFDETALYLFDGDTGETIKSKTGDIETNQKLAHENTSENI